MSLNLNPAYVGSHWDSVEQGAAKTGRKPNRRDWRMVREVFIADTDEEAWKLSIGDMMGRMMTEYFLPLLGHFGFKDYLKASPDVPDLDVTAEYCARHNWIVGSPKTAAEKIEQIWHEVGGFGVLVFGFDYKQQGEAWHHSLSLLKNEVLRRCADPSQDGRQGHGRGQARSLRWWLDVLMPRRDAGAVDVVATALRASAVDGDAVA